MISCDFDPVVSSYLGQDLTDESEHNGYPLINGSHHDRLVKLRGSIYEEGKDARLGFDIVRTDPNGRITVDIIHNSFSRSMRENGVGISIIGGYTYYEGDKRVPTSRTLNFQLESETSRTQRIIHSVADTLVLALALNLSDDCYQYRITNMGFLISDYFGTSHILFSPVFDGENGITSTTVHGTLYVLCGNLADRFYGYGGKGGEYFKKILRRLYPYSSLLHLAEQKGLI